MDNNRDKRLDRLLEKANALPLLPGVYIMRNKNGDIIYIGKAKKLKNRVSQYFRSQERHTEKVRQMVAHVNDFDYIIVDSEFEALILECSLIKQNSPKYNILLKDDKGYHYIHITNEPWRRITAEKQLKGDGENIGPYNSSYMLRQAVDEAKKIFKLPTCNMTFSDGMKRARPCLNAYIGLCCAPCSGKIKRDEYNENVNGAIEFLKKGSADTVKELEREMNDAAEQLLFEKAAKLRDKITAINKLSEKQKVVSSPYPEQDVIAFVKGEKHACFEVFVFRGSRLVDREHFFVDYLTTEEEARSQFIASYYAMRDVPHRIMIDGEVDDLESIAQYLRQKRQKSVDIMIPQKGEQKQLLDMCRNNAAERVAQKEGAYLRDTAVLDELRSLLGLKTVPEYIEAYDISNMAGKENVAGMIVFKNGKPFKSAYKRFAIKSFDGQDDYRSMNEVLCRRMGEYEKHKNDGESYGFGKMPDLILLDGGKGQINAVMPILEKYGMQSRTFGMVKDSHHRTRALVGQYGEIAIKPTRPVFRLITVIQDEVHRFAIGYHHKKSEKASLEMQLCEIEGVGKTRAVALLKAFKGINEIAAANVEQLCKVKGITKTVAQNIYDFFRK